MGKVKYINRIIAAPEDLDAADIFAPERAQVLQAIRLTVDKENCAHIIHFDNPYLAFKALEEKHGSNDTFMIASTTCKIVSIKYENTALLNNYVSQIKIFHNKLNNMTQENKVFQLPDNVLAIFMLINLPTDQFHHIIQSLFSNKSILVKQVTDRLISEALLMKNSAGKEMAMYGFKTKNNSNQKSNENSGNGG
jgi:hypothetical protein